MNDALHASRHTERDGFTIPEFCARFGISTPTYYKMRGEGRAPAEIRMVGSVVRISADAIDAWKRARENDADASAHRDKLKARSQHAVSGGAR